MIYQLLILNNNKKQFNNNSYNIIKFITKSNNILSNTTTNNNYNNTNQYRTLLSYTTILNNNNINNNYNNYSIQYYNKGNNNNNNNNKFSLIISCLNKNHNIIMKRNNYNFLNLYFITKSFYSTLLLLSSSTINAAPLRIKNNIIDNNFINDDTIIGSRSSSTTTINNNNNNNNGDGNTIDTIIDVNTGDIMPIPNKINNDILKYSNLNRIINEYYNNNTIIDNNNFNNNNETDNNNIYNYKNILNTKLSNELNNEIKYHTNDINNYLISIRRLLHQYPELMYNEKITSNIIQNILNELNINYTTGWSKNIHKDNYDGASGGYGIVADIGTGHEPCILLRADMDALPILEQTLNINEFKSLYNNKMHACGHDGHMTMLLGAIIILKNIEKNIPGTIRIIFQPAEEGGAGSKRMIEEGILTKYPKPSYGFGMHVWPTLDSGIIASTEGPILAACERFEILISGVGGHAAMPHLTVDPIVTASSIVMNLQTIVSRTISPLEAGVCSITQINSGSGAYNVIPNSAILKGTIRSLSTKTLLELKNKVQHIVTTTASVHNCNVSITYSPDYYPVTINDPILYNNFSKYIGNNIATSNNNKYITNIEPTMGAEDFSFISENIPSTFFFIGQGSNINPISNYSLHHPKFALDENIIKIGVELHVNLALRSIHQLLLINDNNNNNKNNEYGKII